ncbi:hypothetical protein [Alsobacter sp. R-9]
MKALRRAALSLLAALVLVAQGSSPSLAWRESISVTVPRNKTTGLMKMILYGPFCQPLYIGRIAVRPDPRLGRLEFVEGEENHPELGCKTAKIPFSGVLYKAGPTPGEDKFTLYVSNGEVLEAIKVTVTVR